MSFSEIGQMPIDVYFEILKDAYIYSLKQTQEGRDYLSDCWRMEQTEPDRQALRNRFKP